MCLTLFTKGCSQHITRIKIYEYYTRKPPQRSGSRTAAEALVCVSGHCRSRGEIRSLSLVKTRRALDQAELASNRAVTEQRGSGSPGRFGSIRHLCWQRPGTALYPAEEQGVVMPLLGRGRGETGGSWDGLSQHDRERKSQHETSRRPVSTSSYQPGAAQLPMLSKTWPRIGKYV